MKVTKTMTKRTPNMIDFLKKNYLSMPYKDIAKKLANKKFSMAFVEDFILSCVTQNDGNEVSEKIAYSVLNDLEKHNKNDESAKIGFN